ncbi:hypothetical protein AB4037_23240 [Labrys sp. KB_33_2]|uniref:hypothetical protein n=1 Tax=Labrys sp. KB_33_2 TaxID=3237479 RepID=UPI003F9278E7
MKQTPNTDLHEGEKLTDADIDRITLAVYRARLDHTCKGDADLQVEKDKDSGEKQARRSQSYRPVVIETLVQAGLYTRPVRVAPKRTDRAITESEVGHAE